MVKAKVLIVIGTRPEAIKLLPVYRRFLDSKKFEPLIVSTGQHKEMLNQVFNLFDVRPDFELDVMTSNQGLGYLTAALFGALQDLVNKISPSLVIVQGDTQSGFVAAYVAYYNKIKLAHIEAGLRTKNKYSPFPEEINRQSIGLISDFDFAPTQLTYKNLINEGKKNVVEVGNTVIDALNWCSSVVEQKLDTYFEKFTFLDVNRTSILITGHRRENFGKPFENVLEALITLSLNYPDFDFVFPVHMNPNVKSTVHNKLSELDNVYLIEPVSYDEMVFLMKQSKLIITDSGGIQEEAPSLDKPVLVTRDTTERMEGVEAGCLKLVGTDKENIVKTFADLIINESTYATMAKSANPFGDGSSSSKIVDYLESEF